ncbi:MAG: LTA synthase family protein [Bacteroidota bacterium]
MQIFKTLYKSWKQYLNIIFLSYLFAGMLRIIQIFFVPGSLNEISLGLLMDILHLDFVLLIFFLLFTLFYSIFGKKVVPPVLVFVLLIFLSGVPFWNHTLSKGELINPFLFNCSLSLAYQKAIEAGNMFLLMLILLFTATTGLFIYFWNNKTIGWHRYLPFFFLFIVLVSVPALLETRISAAPNGKNQNHWAKNPGFYALEKKMYCIAGWKDLDSEAESYEQYQSLYSDRSFLYPEEYPFLKTQTRNTCLSEFFPEKPKEDAPDIVFLLLEGLGNNYLDTLYDYSFMPFLRSLADSSLYWQHHFAVSEEAQNFLPALLGGLPPAAGGFSEIPVVPYHFSLINTLHYNQYYGSFYTSQWSWDHSLDKFLRQNRMNSIYDAGNFPEEEEKIYLGDDQYFWGYNDRQLFDFYFNSQKEEHPPRLDVIYTRGIRSPFAIENKEYYKLAMDSVIALQKSISDAEYLELFHPYYLSLLFTDDQLKSFFDRYKEVYEYENTIFIITGSFPTPELHPELITEKYHVPLIIYSPMLRKTRKITSITSHYDVFESITGLLHENFDLEIPQYNTSVGKTLCRADTTQQLIPLLDAKNKISSIIHNNYFFHQDTTLCHLGKNTTEKKNSEESKEKHAALLHAFKELNKRSSETLMPDSVFFDFFGHEIVEEITMDKNFIRTEYKDIVDNMQLDNQTYHMDVVIQNPDVSLEEVFLIFEAKDASGNVVFWENFGVPKDNKDLSINLTIEKEFIPEQGAELKVYVWNQSPVPYGFDAIQFRIYN